MRIQFKKLTPKSIDLPTFENINDEAFPPYERMSTAEMFRLSTMADADLLGIYDDDMPIGFAFIVKNSRCGYLYYYAICDKMRSLGYGGTALRELVRKYDDIQIFLDFEALDENADNYEQRVRRKRFYLSNGFFETGRYTKLCNEPFEVVCSQKEVNLKCFEELLVILALHNKDFADTLF